MGRKEKKAQAMGVPRSHAKSEESDAKVLIFCILYRVISMLWCINFYVEAIKFSLVVFEGNMLISDVRLGTLEAWGKDSYNPPAEAGLRTMNWRLFGGAVREIRRSN